VKRTPPFASAGFARMPIACPSSRAKPVSSSLAKSFFTSTQLPSSISASTTLRMSYPRFASAGSGPRSFARPWCFGNGNHRFLARALWHVLESRSARTRSPPVIGDQSVAAATFGAMHARAAQLLRDSPSRRPPPRPCAGSEVHRGVALDHDHDVAERRDVSAAGRRRPTGCRSAAPVRKLHLIEEDAARMAPAGEHVDLNR